ncbi:MAG: hypothetical protein OFPII_43050 [Osedax symbiont Rs1]|nr:MAG: hypothetical protein OFPII_43050 [Osedax symbiont Rs1]
MLERGSMADAKFRVELPDSVIEQKNSIKNSSFGVHFIS